MFLNDLRLARAAIIHHQPKEYKQWVLSSGNRTPKLSANPQKIKVARKVTWRAATTQHSSFPLALFSEPVRFMLHLKKICKGRMITAEIQIIIFDSRGG